MGSRAKLYGEKCDNHPNQANGLENKPAASIPLASPLFWQKEGNRHRDGNRPDQFGPP
jgi:hypothetical protein